MTQDKWDRLQATAESWQCPAPDFNSPAVERHHKVSAVIQLLQQAMATKLAQSAGGNREPEVGQQLQSTATARSGVQLHAVACS